MFMSLCFKEYEGLIVTSISAHQLEESQNWIEIILSDHGYNADDLEIESTIHYFQDDVVKETIILWVF